ncbi:MAG: hypothetical protein HZR80_13600 [Candidatus Heimdallarchaeota archaeon]
MRKRNTLLLVVFLNILLHIPRILYGYGMDGFQLLWEGKLLISGDLFSKGYSFSSIIGAFPFTGYPILAIFFISFFLLITGQNVFVTIILYDLFFTSIFIISSYFLTNELELNPRAKFIFLIILTTLPNYLIYSSYTSSSRLPFWSLLPFVLYFLLKWNKTHKFQNYVYAVLVFVPLFFIHRMSMVVGIIFVVSLAIGLLEILTKKKLLYNLHLPLENNIIKDESDEIDLEQKSETKMKVWNYFKQRFWIFSIIFSAIIAYILLYTYFKDNSQWATTQLDLYCFIGKSDFFYNLIQPLFDQWFHFGTAFLIFLLFVVLLFIPKFNSLLVDFNKNQSNLYLTIFSLPFIIVFDIVYSFYFLGFLISLGAAIVLDYLFKKSGKLVISLLILIIGFLISTLILLNHYLVYSVFPYNIVAFFVLIFVSIYTISNLLKEEKLEKVKFYKDIIKNPKYILGIIILLLIVNSTFLVDRQTKYYSREGFITNNINNEYIRIADFLSSNDRETFCSFDQTISSYIAALSGWFFLQDPHSLTILLKGNKNIEQINCSIIPPYRWYLPSIYECSDLKSYEYYSLLIHSDCLDSYSMFILKTFSIKYFITVKNSSIINLHGYKVYSNFINSLNLNDIPIVMRTDNYLIWDTGSLYS